MAADYAATAKRHWDDAEFLRENNRLPNADQLYGLAAECSLKAIMVGLGAPVVQGMPSRNHIDDLWAEYQVFLQGFNASRYWSPLSEFSVNPFADWSTNQRYESGLGIPSGSVIDKHRKA